MRGVFSQSCTYTDFARFKRALTSHYKLASRQALQTRRSSSGHIDRVLLAKGHRPPPMFFAREQHQQHSRWVCLKTPAAVSAACLVAFLLLAGQALRHRPAAKTSSVAQVEPTFSHGYSDAGDEAGVGVESLAKETFNRSREWHTSSGAAALQKPVNNISDILFLSNEQKYNVTAVETVAADSKVLVIEEDREGVQLSGILLVFHGCSHSALDWWHSTAGCPDCKAMPIKNRSQLRHLSKELGQRRSAWLAALPEELQITKAALRRKFAVVAFTSLDREVTRCWDTTYPPEKSADIAAVAKAWLDLMDRKNWGRIPHYAIGGSSGGAFALHLAQRLPLDGVCSIAKGVQPLSLDSRPRTPDSSRSWPFPPTVFVTLERDELTAADVAADVVILRKQGVPVHQIIVQSRPLSEKYFSDRIDGFEVSTSQAMYEALLLEGCINATGHLLDNPRAIAMMRKWQKALRTVDELRTANFNKDESPIFEELNVAWAGHELVSDHADEIFEWFAARNDGLKLMTAVNPRR